MAKVNNKENICFVKDNNFHNMHIAIKPILKAFKTLHNEYKQSKEDIIYLKTPIDHHKIAKINSRMK